ncbi:ribonuclease HII [Trinickia sp.]|uniref:ribonuclease HII n=1 Tax=Trinickia sp. TaxID=2571163 RepID=UPI0039C9FAB9
MTASRATRRPSQVVVGKKVTRQTATNAAVDSSAGTVPRDRAVKSVQSALEFESPLDIVCGVDEAGRGPLAGPVVAAAVILDPKRRIRGLDDSKVLNAKTREALYEKIVERSIAYCIASASVEEIDSLNILHATMLAMKRAVEGLAVTPTLAKIDGNRCPVLSVRSEAIIGGDALVPAISAASILAKVTRDRMLADLHLRFPMYGFDSHVGYGTPQHLAALLEHGPCEHHRRSFAPVREAYARSGIAVALPQGVEVVTPTTLEEVVELVGAGQDEGEAQIAFPDAHEPAGHALGQAVAGEAAQHDTPYDNHLVGPAA